jgi:hypothetical protein
MAANQDISGNITTWNGIIIAPTNIIKINVEVFVFVRTSTHAAIDVISIISATETTVIITDDTNDEP